MSNQELIDQLISAEASLEMSLKQVRRSRKILESVDSSAPQGEISLKQKVAIAVAKNATMRIRNLNAKS